MYSEKTLALNRVTLSKAKNRTLIVHEYLSRYSSQPQIKIYRYLLRRKHIRKLELLEQLDKQLNLQFHALLIYPA